MNKILNFDTLDIKREEVSSFFTFFFLKIFFSVNWLTFPSNCLFKNSFLNIKKFFIFFPVNFIFLFFDPSKHIFRVRLPKKKLCKSIIFFSKQKKSIFFSTFKRKSIISEYSDSLIEKKNEGFSGNFFFFSKLVKANSNIRTKIVAILTNSMSFCFHYLCM